MREEKVKVSTVCAQDVWSLQSFLLVLAVGNTLCRPDCLSQSGPHMSYG